MVAAKKKTQSKTEVRSKIIGEYMNYVLEHEKKPVSIYKFCKNIDVDEEDFYENFGSIDSLEKMVWAHFVEHTLSLLNKSKEYPKYATREKVLTFYYTLFELLTANRSYVLFAIQKDRFNLNNLAQLSELRKSFKSYLKELEEPEEKNKYKEFTTKALEEGAWIQLLMVLKFWIEDGSPSFEKTDVLIEKAINTTFDLLDRSPVEGVIDLAKFLIKEKLN